MPRGVNYPPQSPKQDGVARLLIRFAVVYEYPIFSASPGTRKRSPARIKARICPVETFAFRLAVGM